MVRAGLTKKGKFEQSLEGDGNIGRAKPEQKPFGQRELLEQRPWAMSRVLKGWQIGCCGWRRVYGGRVTEDKVGMGGGCLCVMRSHAAF